MRDATRSDTTRKDCAGWLAILSIMVATSTFCGTASKAIRLIWSTSTRHSTRTPTTTSSFASSPAKSPPRPVQFRQAAHVQSPAGVTIPDLGATGGDTEAVGMENGLLDDDEVV